MDTEKYYYGLNLDLETTKKDSSNIDCELPEKLPENPSLNTTNTSLLNKGSVSLLSKYVKIDDCPQTFTLTKHNDAITNSSLQVLEVKLLDINGDGSKISYNYSISFGNNNLNLGTKKDVYLGYEDSDKIFTNKLGSIITTQVTTLDSDTAGCSAKAYLIPNDNTGVPIKYSLNKCTANRTITFSYKNLPIFKIKQTYDNSGSSTTKSWTLYVCALSGTDFTYSKSFALFDTNSPMTFSVSTYGNQIQFIGFQLNQTTYVVIYTPDKKIIMNYQSTTIGTLLKNGNLIHLSGHDYLTQNKYKDLYLDNINFVNHWESNIGGGTLSTKSITFDKNIYVYIQQSQDFICMPNDTFNFSNIEASNHLGVYKLQTTS